MEEATELFPGDEQRTRVWITPLGSKEMGKVRVDDDLIALLHKNAVNGFQGYQGYALRNEGPGVWAFGTATWTARIVGYFTDDAKRAEFVIGGAWKGKSGKGNARPAHAEAIVLRIAALKKAGVKFVKPSSPLNP